MLCPGHELLGSSVHFVRRQAMSSKCRRLKPTTLFDCVTNALALSATAVCFPVHDDVCFVTTSGAALAHGILPLPWVSFIFVLCFVIIVITTHTAHEARVLWVFMQQYPRQSEGCGRSAKKRRMTPGKKNYAQRIGHTWLMTFVTRRHICHLAYVIKFDIIDVHALFSPWDDTGINLGTCMEVCSRRRQAWQCQLLDYKNHVFATTTSKLLLYYLETNVLISAF